MPDTPRIRIPEMAVAAKRPVIGVILKHTLNPLTLRIARSSHGPFAIVRHVGRKSGRTFETPIIVRRLPDGFMIELTYGPHVDWYRNLRAAGGCEISYHGTTHVITAMEPVTTELGIGAFSPAQRRILRLLRRHAFVKLVELRG
jgi:deazaflavin-dependent oxidoreductase (nitroreductase family)